MSLAGNIIIINSPDSHRTQNLIQLLQKAGTNTCYYHVGLSTLIEQFLSNSVKQWQEYLPALYTAISATARCNADVLSDMSITTKSQYQSFLSFTEDLDVIWINLDANTSFIDYELELNSAQSDEALAMQIHHYLIQRKRHALSSVRWVTDNLARHSVETAGKIVLLIGAPSAGKSTLLNAIQQSTTETFLNVGIDTTVIHTAPLRYLSGVAETDDDWDASRVDETTNYHQQGWSWIAPGPSSINPHPHLRLRLGPIARQSMSIMYATIAAFSRLGYNVLSDHCFHIPSLLTEAQDTLHDLPVVYVKLCPQLQVIQQREQQRGNRMHGMGESVYLQMCNDYTPHLEIDTGKFTPEKAAQLVIDFINE